MSDAISSFGTQLQMGDGATPEVFTTIAEVKDINGASQTVETADVTHQQSPQGVREKLGVISDSGQVTFTINYLKGDATHDATDGLAAKMVSRETTNFKMIDPDDASSTESFAGIVTALSPTRAVAGALTADVTIDITGPITHS